MPPADKTFSLDSAPEAFFTSATTSRAIRRLVRGGDARRLASRLYTKNLADGGEAIVRRNLWPIVGGYFPGAVVSDRTALEYQPTEDGSVFLTHRAKDYRTVELPGLTIRARPGNGALPTDRPFIAGLHVSSEARAFLENLRPSRRGSGPPRTLTRAQIEQRVTEIAARRGDGALNELRDQARSIAGQLQAEREFDALDNLVGGLLGTKPTELTTPEGIARREGRPFDSSRAELFDLLFAEIKRHVTEPRPERPDHAGTHFSFYEAYFSNYIEGTEFLVEEAKAIVFEGRIPSQRPQDAHDILGTFQLVNDPRRRARAPTDIDDYLELLRESHALMLSGRPEARPGQFKDRPNQVGGVIFVDPRLVEGTLAAGFERYQALEPGFERAVFQMFLLAEVHPFDDGNGRLARAIANAELSAAGQQRIMITTAQRDAYLGGLRALSYNKDPKALLRILDRTQAFSAEGEWSSDEAALRTLNAVGAFTDPYGGQAIGDVLRGAMSDEGPREPEAG